MNDREQFEERLQRQPLREVPDAWREEILRTARKAGSSRNASPAARHALLSTLSQQFSSLLWPHPRAWAGLTGVWVVICAMNFAHREDTTSTAASRFTPPSPQTREMLRAQEQMLAELFDQWPAVDRTKARPPRPHSFHRNEFLNA